MQATITSAGAIVFDAGPTLSPQQVAILSTLASTSDRPLERAQLHQVLWPGHVGALSTVQRATLARSLRRMETWGWIVRSTPSTIQITPMGTRLFHWLSHMNGWPAYRGRWIEGAALTQGGDKGDTEAPKGTMPG